MPARRIAVIGAGITGATAAHTLAEAGIADVVVFESAPTVGGRVATSAFAGVDAVDEGADAFLVRVPDAIEFASRLGLGDSLVHPEPVHAAIWHGDRLHPIPDGLLLGMPGRLLPLARTGLLSVRGKVRAATEAFRPRTAVDSDSIGAYVRARFGDEVHERLVDALVGSIYATDTDRFSLAEVPQLASMAEHRSVLVEAARRARSSRTPTNVGPAPIFAAPSNGLAGLVNAAVENACRLGADIRCSTRVATIHGNPDTTNPDTTNPDTANSDTVGDGGHSCGVLIDGEAFDAAVLACPAQASIALLASIAPAASALLRAADTADVIIVTMHIGDDDWPDRLRGMSGYLVPKPVQRDVTAVSFGSQKWAHWKPPSGGEIIRVSLGRDDAAVLHLDDHEIVERAIADLHRHLGVRFTPREIRVTRWPGAFAQYRPHHRRWVDEVRSTLPPGVFVAGASYDGIGIPACIRSGRKIGRSAVDLVGNLAS